MSWEQVLMLWSSSAAVSGVIWFLLLVVLLYLARLPAHEMILASARMLRQALRLAAHSVMRAEERVAQRNREVLLSLAEESEARFIEHEFQRVNTIVSRDLSGYPAMHRALSDQIAHIDEDYRQSTETPPMPPAWVEAVAAVAKIPTKGDPVVGQILEDIHTTVERTSREALEEYRTATRKRHMWLKRMLPYWRRLTTILTQVDKTITGLEERSRVIDTQMGRYEEIRAKSDRMVRTLASSATSQFFIAGLVLAIAVMGGVINFQLIARPMSEMIGGTTEVLPGVRFADVGAMVIITLEITLGLFLMELLRITRLLPVIGALDEKLRLRLTIAVLTFLTIFASIEAGLAYMRDMLAAQDEALVQLLADTGSAQAVEAPAFRWIPSTAQMVLGFILPFALMLVAVPLESFIHSSRTVSGRILVAMLRMLATGLRVLGNFFHGLGRVLIHAYDLLIFLPLSVERTVRQVRGGHDAEAHAPRLAASGSGAAGALLTKTTKGEEEK